MIESCKHESRPDCNSIECCRLTGDGRSAVAVVALRDRLQSSDNVHRLIAACFQSASATPMKADQIRYGVWTGPPEQHKEQHSEATHSAATKPGGSVTHGESVVVLPLDRGRMEIHCHGGQAAVGRILDDLAALGCQIVSSIEVLADEFATDGDSSETGRLVREALEVLIRCPTQRTAAIALDQVRGGMTRWAIDSRTRLRSDRDAWGEVSEQAVAILRHANVGLHLVSPFDVVLAGPPNVGKSSLLNAVIGYDRAITMDQPGTTRDVLSCETVIDGWPIRFRDTAGLHEGGESIEREGMRRAQSAIAEADLVVAVRQAQDGSPPPTSDSLAWLESSTVAALRPLPILHVLNKVDLLAGSPDLRKQTDVLYTVATTAVGIPELMAKIIARLVPQPPSTGEPVPLNRRQRDCLETIARAKNSTESGFAEVDTALTRLLGLDEPV
ncbi:tRNA modification GTPase MnmE [Stieleria varia]|uniref:tRNA modification GTPase MnmE n=2 Tax=Stieleria varia TaxID=2528005 RepID=A0A5C6AGP1_9BACT|nr:tRNA modification GTPase MnmE [Stieleria varia]